MGQCYKCAKIVTEGVICNECKSDAVDEYRQQKCRSCEYIDKYGCVKCRS